ncbi:MAG: SCP2 sterol-binding domain-containing protein [Actinomycetota bacterium]
MARFPSEEWIAAFVDQVNASAGYRDAGATWEGDIAFVFEAEPDKGVAEPVVAWLDLWHGECRGWRLMDLAEADTAAYTIRAPYSRWKDVLNGDLDPIKGLMQGKLKLQGDLPTIVRYVRAANELVQCTTLVPTEFPDA